MAEQHHSLFDWYNGLGKWRGVVVFTTIGITTYSVVEIIKAVKNHQNLAKAQKEVSGFASDLNNLTTGTTTPDGQPELPTFPDTQYATWADSITQEYTGKDFSFAVPFPTCEYSDSGAFVYNILNQLVNNADFLKLQIAWGVRTIDKGWLESNYTNVSLSAAITAQSANCEIQGFNALLTTKGITYQF